MYHTPYPKLLSSQSQLRKVLLETRLHFTNILKSNVPPDIQIFADIPGHRASDTLPAAITPNIDRPDIVVIQSDMVTLLKLTVPLN